MPEPGYLLIPLRARDGTLRAHATIDEADRRLTESPWSMHSAGYAYRSVRSGGGVVQAVLLHREVLGLAPGDGLEADHENGDRLDCRRSNLRIGTHALNMQNVTANRGGTSVHRGVCWDAARGKWQAGGQLNGKRVNLGRYADELEAARVARDWRLGNMPFTNEER
jgi:hypothetical protein